MKLTEITIIETVADYFKVELSDLRSQCREAGVVRARHLAFYFCRNKTGLPLRVIGNLLNREHASVIHAVHSVNNQIDTNQKYRNHVNRIAELLVGVSDTNQDCEYFMENDCYSIPVAEKTIESIYVSPFEGKEDQNLS